MWFKDNQRSKKRAVFGLWLRKQRIEGDEFQDVLNREKRIAEAAVANRPSRLQVFELRPTIHHTFLGTMEPGQVKGHPVGFSKAPNLCRDK